MTEFKSHEDKNSFLELIQKQKRIFIVTHSNPDPDTLCSALGMQFLIKKLIHKEAKILKTGNIGRAENRNLVDEVGIKCFPLEKYKFAKDDFIILLDTQISSGTNPLSDKIQPDVIFDHHHCTENPAKIKYFDIRPEIGATSTIIYEYLMFFNIKLTKKMATALFYAIKTDTDNLSRNTTKQDVDTYHDLIKQMNARAIARIENPDLSLDYYKLISEGLQKAIIYEDIICVFLDEVRYPDYVSLIADFFLKYEQANWVMVMGRYNEKQLLISLRNIHTRKNAGHVIKEVIGKKGAGGGHTSFSGGQIDITSMEEKDIGRIEKELVSKLLVQLKGKVLIGEVMLHASSPEL